MKKIYLFFIWFQIGVLNTSYSQTSEKIGREPITYDKIPKETIFVHYNSAVLFAGETLFYKIYCTNLKTNNLSTLSKIAYVELIDSESNFIFKHKIKLDSGQGGGDFFISAKVSSGSYKLIAYTQWMKNDDSTSFFQSDVMIINPYEKNQTKAINKEHNAKEDSLTHTTTNIPRTAQYSTKKTMLMSTDQSQYKKREKVSATITSFDSLNTDGNYSVSVRKTTEIDSGTWRSLQKPNPSSQSKIEPKRKDIYLPELRGELLSGRVKSKETGKNLPNVTVVISIPGKIYFLNMVTTDETGRFFFNIDKDYDGENAIIQVLNMTEEVEILTNPLYSSNYTSFQFPDFRVDTTMKSLIEQRSIHSQIENAYSEIRQDSMIPAAISYPFFYEKSFDIYDLDDYTRFTSVRETFVEVIQHTSIRNIEGKSEFMVIPSNPQLQSLSLPLIIVDGIFLQNAKDIIAINAKKIKRILVFREQYFYGSILYQGALVFETLDGDYYQNIDKKDKHIVKLFKPQPIKKYYKQKYGIYNQSVSSHIPDYRHQLLWQPNITFEGSEMIIDFYTSDVIGKFEICLEGVTYKGKPVSLQKTITVK